MESAMSDLRVYHLGYYLNRYAGWYRIEHFSEAIDVVRWLRNHARDIDGDIDFLVYRID
jgi:hypothetical protein